MSQKEGHPKMEKPSSPLIRASNWRQNLDESVRNWLPAASMRYLMDDFLKAIERASGSSGHIILPLINSICSQNISPLGQEAIRSFFESMHLFSIRARIKWPDVGEGDAPLERIKCMQDFAVKLGSIASNVSNERAFCLICSGMERIKDFRVLSKYINYMHSASKQIRSEKNSGGAVSSPELLAFHAKFIAERSDGTNAAYVDGLLSKFIMALNEPKKSLP